MTAQRRLLAVPLRALFERHVEQNLRLPLRVPPGCGLRRAWLHRGTLHVEGQTETAVRIVAQDQEALLQIGPSGGFVGVLALPVGAGGAQVWLDGRQIILTVPDAVAVAQARWRHLPRFAADLARTVPVLLRWLWLGRPDALIAQIRARLSLSHVAAAGVLDPRRLGQPQVTAPPPDLPIQIVMPVFNALTVLRAAVERVAAHTDLPYRLIVINDASTDPEVAVWLHQRLASLPAVLLENDRNLGFLGSANRGLAVARAVGGHVVLLNSDALLPVGWASRLLAPILTAPGVVASVTPLSNAAEILSVPLPELAPGQADALDTVAQRLGTAPQPVPTGVGFCMAMNAEFLARLPQFDPAFGRGYGEEVDWCQRARALGGKHLALPGLFVEHRSAASFGVVERRQAVRAAAGLLRRRYPRYDAEVQRFAAIDPLLTERLALGIGGLAGGGPVPLYIGHALAGGAEADLRRRLAQHPAALVLRLGGVLRWRLELHGQGQSLIGETAEFDLIRRLLQPLRHRHLVYNCAVGDADPVALPGLLLSLLTDADRLDVLMHDYFPLSPSFTLLPANGVYCGVPGPLDPDPAHTTRRPDGTPVSLAQWRVEWGRLMARADAVTCFSQASAALVVDAYPHCASRLRIAPHPLPHVPSMTPPGTRPVLGVLGNIRLHKGAAQVVALAALRPDLPIVIIGQLDPSLRPPPGVRVHGQYRPADLPDLMARYGITRWLIPSIWPETFCFTVHEALATGLPVLGFDLGAQAEALRAAPNGQVVPVAGGASALANAVS